MSSKHRCNNNIIIMALEFELFDLKDSNYLFYSSTVCNENYFWNVNTYYNDNVNIIVVNL